MQHIMGHLQALEHNKKYARCVVLNNLSGKPFTNLKTNLARYSTVHNVIQLVEDGQVTKSNSNLTLCDTVAFVLQCSVDYIKMNEECQQILMQDAIGWE